MRPWELALLRFMETSYPEIGKDIAEKKRITEENMAKLRSALDAFTSTYA
jgi:F-type H+-transporting ATPase subunit alpha